MQRTAIVLIVVVCAAAAVGAVATFLLAGRAEQADSLATQATLDEPELALPTEPSGASAAKVSNTGCPIQLVDVIEETGIDFVNFSGMSPEKLYPSANNTGVALIDYDQDNHLDVFFGNGELLLPGGEDPPTQFWRSLGDGRFENVTEPSGLKIHGFTFGLGVGDYNNDGFPDLYVARYGDYIMMRNNGDGTFSDVTAEAAVGDDHWANSVAFLDYDYDGVLDLYVTNYGDWNLQWHRNHVCGEGNPFVKLFCTPKIVPVVPNLFYRGLGDGRFKNVIKELGLQRPDSRSTSVVAVDLNLDGLIDLYVTNDLEPNFTFINVGDG
ncbi:MAG TPA: VCBS repeat-containing protein [Planctomycetaceae bacterium]|nr:VCBS repeat-containing protein [Planctomycetaceae bacterium]